MYVFASTLRADPAFANKIITTAPQTPYLTGVGSSGITANGTYQSFTNIVPPSQLNATYIGNAGNQYSLLAPLGGQLVDYNFLQVYNNASYAYPTGMTAPNWNNALAGWGIQALQAGGKGKHPKLIVSFASTDGTPLLDNDTTTAFNTSLLTANSTIQAFSTTTGVLPYSSVTIKDWCGGAVSYTHLTLPTKRIV